MGNYQPVNIRKNSLNSESSQLSATNLRCDTNEGEFPSRPKYSNSGAVSTIQYKKPSVKINTSNLEKALVQNETRKPIFSNHRAASPQSDLLSSYVVYTARDQTQHSEPSNPLLKPLQSSGPIFRSANLPMNGLQQIPSVGTQSSMSYNPNTRMTFNPTATISNPILEYKGPLPEPLTTSQVTQEERMHSQASQQSERLVRAFGIRNFIFDVQAERKPSIPALNATLLSRPDQAKEEYKDGLSDRIPTSSDQRFETLSTEPQVSMVHETKMKKIHFRSKSPGSNRDSRSLSPIKNPDLEKPVPKVTVPPLGKVLQALAQFPANNLPPLGPSANSYSKAIVSDRKSYQSGSDSARQNYHFQNMVQSRYTAAPLSVDEPRSYSLDKISSLKDYIDKTGGRMPFFNPFQNENHSRTIGKEYTQEIDKLAHEIAQNPNLKLSSASFESSKSRSLSVPDNHGIETTWRHIDDFFAARGWMSSGIRNHNHNESVVSNQSLFTNIPAQQTGANQISQAPQVEEKAALQPVGNIKTETNYFTLSQKEKTLQSVPKEQTVSQPLADAHAQGSIPAVPEPGETKRYNTNEKVENILKRINDLNSKQANSFVLASALDYQTNAEYDYAPPVVASSANQIIISLSSPIATEKNSSQNRLMDLTKTADDQSHSESFIFAKVSESSQPADSVDHKDNLQDVRQSKNPKDKAELVLSDISKRIEEFTKILNTSHQEQPHTEPLKHNPEAKIDSSISLISSAQHVSIGSPNPTHKNENPEPIESQSPVKSSKVDPKISYQKTSVFNLSLNNLRVSEPLVQQEATMSSQKNDEVRKTTTESTHLNKEEYKDKIIEKPEERSAFFSRNNQSYQPSAENSPKNVHIPSLNVSEIHKHKFFDEKEWSQPVSPSAEWSNLVQNDSSRINDKIDKIAEEIKKADQLLEERKNKSSNMKSKALSPSRKSENAFSQRNSPHKSPKRSPKRSPKKSPKRSPKKSPKKSSSSIPVKKYSLQHLHKKAAQNELTLSSSNLPPKKSARDGPKEVKISITNLSTKQKITEMDSFQEEAASPRDHSHNNFNFANDSHAQDIDKKKSLVSQTNKGSFQNDFEFITEDLDTNKPAQNIFDPRTFSNASQSLATLRSTNTMDQDAFSNRSRPYSPLTKGTAFSTLDERSSGLSSRTDSGKNWPKTQRDSQRGYPDSPKSKNSYNIKNIPPHRMLQKSVTPPKIMEQRKNSKERSRERSGSISDRNFTLGENNDPPKVQNNNIFKQPSPKRTEASSKLHHISTSQNKKPKTTTTVKQTSEPLNTKASNGNYTSKDELDIPSVDTNYINDDLDNYSIPIRENISPASRGKRLDRTVTESEKLDLIQRLSNSPFIKKYELEPPDDPSLRFEPSYVEMSDEEREKKIKLELTKLQHKIKDVDSLTRILMSDQFRELLKIEGVNSNKSTSRHEHLKNSPSLTSLRDKNTSRNNSPLKRTSSQKKFGQPTNLNEQSPFRESQNHNMKPLIKGPIHRRSNSNIVSVAIPNFKKAGYEQVANALGEDYRQNVKGVYTPTKTSANERRKGIPVELR